MVAATTLAAADLQDLTGQVTASVTDVRTSLDRRTREYVTTGNLRVTNTGQEPVIAPVHAVFTTVPEGVQVSGGPGTEPCGPYCVDLSGSLPAGTLSPGEALTVPVKMVSRVRFQYSLAVFRVLADDPQNQPPQLTSIAPQTVAEGGNLTFAVSATDPDSGDQVTLQALSIPDGATFDPLTGSFSWAPGYDQAGDYTARFQATDGEGLSADLDVSIRVTDVDRPPTLRYEGPVEVAEGATLSGRVIAVDPDGAGAVNVGLEGLPDTAGLNPSTGAFSWSPSYAEAGDYTARFSAIDAGGVSSELSVEFSVLDMNRDPVIESTPPTAAIAGQQYVYQLAASDPDGDPPAFRLLQGPAGADLDPQSGRLTWTPPTGPDLVDFGIEVTDGRGGEDTQSFQVAVAEPSDETPPVIESVDLPAQAVAGTMVPVSAVVTDDRGVAEVRFLVEGALVGTDTEAPFEAEIAVQADAAGTTLTVTVEAEDAAGNGASAQADLPVVEPPDETPPVIGSVDLPAEAAAGTVVRVSAVVTDDRGVAQVRFLADGVPVGTDTEVPYEAEISVPADAGGTTLTVTVEAEDAAGNRVSFEAVLQVLEPPDTASPVVRLTAPASVLAGGVLTLTAEVGDDRGVASVAFEVDGLVVRELSAGPFRLDYNVPEVPGTVLAVRVVGRDAAGNVGEATAEVAVTDAPDTEPPVIASLILPPSAAAGSTVIARAEATDDRGVALVRFLVNGALVAADDQAPFEASLEVPAGGAGQTLLVRVEAEDAEGNQGSAEAELEVVEAADTAPPSQVTLTAPAEALPGALVRLDATAVDDVGVLKLIFLVDGVEVSEDVTPPYAADYRLPADAQPGDTLRLQAVAYDFSGNQASSPIADLLVLVPGEGILRGTVFDDASGLPLAGVRVAVERVDGDAPDPARETLSGADGTYLLGAPAGTLRLGFERDGYTGAVRDLGLAQGTAARVADVRLTPEFQPAAGSTGTLAALAFEPRWRLELPADASPASADATLVPFGAQALPAPLPLGWTPVAGVVVRGPGGAFSPALALTYDDSSPDLVPAQWRATTGAWVRAESVVDDAGLNLPLTGPGWFVLLRPDTRPVAPPIPAVGEPVTGVDPVPIPADATARVLPSPDVIFMHPNARSDVRVVLSTPEPLPSGTPVQVQVTERYDRTDGSRLLPDPFVETLRLYQRPGGFDAELAVSPSRTFDPVLLREGLIRLDAAAGAEPGIAVVGAAGGAVSATNGAQLLIPAGVFGAETPVELRVLDLAGMPEGTLASLWLDLRGESLSQAAILTWPRPEGLADDAQVLLVRTAEVGGSSRELLVDVMTVEADRLVSASGALGLPLPGVREGGQYRMVLAAEPLGFVTGAVTQPGLADPRALVSLDALPYASLVGPGLPAYALAAPIGTASIRAEAVADGATSTGDVSIGAQGVVIVLDLELTAARLTVTEVSPAEGVSRVDVTTDISMVFSRPVEETTITPDSLGLTAADGTPVPGSRSLLPDRLTVFFRPDAPLAGLTEYRLRLTPAISDRFGNALLGGEPDGSFLARFTTLDTAPPPAPAPGQITLSIPQDGTTEIRGTQGSLPPGGVVFIFNRTQGLQTAARAGADGGFFAILGAEASDLIDIVLVSEAGEQTPLPPIPFIGPDGTTLLGGRGGAARSAGGLAVSVIPDALLETAEVRVQDLDPADLAAGLPADLSPRAAFRLALGDVRFNDAVFLEVAETGAQLESAISYTTPLSLRLGRVTSDAVNGATRFTFLARVLDTAGESRAVTVAAGGQGVVCGDTATAVDEANAPRLRLTAPTCLGPSQSFELAADAIQPRFDLVAPAPEGAAEGDAYLLLSPVEVGGEAAWLVADLARVEARDGGLAVVTRSASPFGLRAAGDYLLVRAASPLAFVEGMAAGPEALISAEGWPLVAASAGSNGAFLLPVKAGEPLTLRSLEPGDGSVRDTLALDPIAAGETLSVGELGGDARSPLTVDVLLPPDAVLNGSAALLFAFSEPLDPGTVAPATLIVTDEDGRLVPGSRVLTSDGASLRFQPDRPWALGAEYGYRLTTGLAAVSGSRLTTDVTGTFAGFAPALVGELEGTDVRDAAVLGTVAYLVDGANVRSVELRDPAAPVEEGPVTPEGLPNRVAVAGEGADARLLVSAGRADEYGRLHVLDLTVPLAPAGQRARLLSTPVGAPLLPDVPEVPGAPGGISVLPGAVTVASRGAGLERLDLESLLAEPATALLTQHPLGGGSFTEAATAGDWLVSVGADGVQVHDSESLAVQSVTTDLDGTPLDVAGAAIGGRTLALVAAGLPGGVQVYEIDAEGVIERVAKILTGCAVSRVAVDEPLGRAWLACSGNALWGLELKDLDGLEPIDRNGDRVDDRLSGAVPIGFPVRNLTLDAPRALALVAAGPEGLKAIQTGSAEAVITDVIRDPIPGDYGDEESILDSGEAYYGDQVVQVIVQARIPPGHPGLRAVLHGPDGTAFANGGLEVAVAPGTNLLEIRSPALPGASASPFSIVVERTDGVELARFAGSYLPVPLDRLLSVNPAPATTSVSESVPLPLSLRGRDASGRSYNVTAHAQIESLTPEICRVGPDGLFTPLAGGEGRIGFRLGNQRGQIRVQSALPAALTRIELSPAQGVLRQVGAQLALEPTGIFTDGSSRSLTQADGLDYVSDAPNVATVDQDGTVTAVSEGFAQITAGAGGRSGHAVVRVSPLQVPVLDEIVVDSDAAEVAADVGYLTVRVWARGSGSLGGLPVTLRAEGPGWAAPEVQSETNGEGLATMLLTGLTEGGAGRIVATVTNTEGSQVLTGEIPLTVARRNLDGPDNDSPDTATPLSLGASVRGQLDAAGDPLDVYRLDLTRHGTLTVGAHFDDRSDFELVLTNADGSVFAQGNGVDGDLTLSGEVQRETLYLTLRSLSGGGSYVLGSDFRAPPPAITAITPAAGEPGDVVVISGSGFDRRAAEHVVLFSGIATEVLSSAPDRLEVVVPAFATDGEVTVTLGSKTSNGHGFSTGVPASAAESPFLIEPPADQIVEDLFSPNPVVAGRLVVGFRAHVTRPAVEAIAAARGGAIVGLSPARNRYTMEFPNVLSQAALLTLMDALAALPEVRYATPVYVRQTQGFPVATRDKYSDPNLALGEKWLSAYAQVNAPQAWEAIQDSGYFDEPSKFYKVKVAVIDTGHNFNATNEPQLGKKPVDGIEDPNAVQKVYRVVQGDKPQSDAGDHRHGTAVAGVIGAKNTGEPNLSNGILGGVWPQGTLHAYEILNFDASRLDADGDISPATIGTENALRGCKPKPPPSTGYSCTAADKKEFEIVNMSYGIDFPDPMGTVSANEIAAVIEESDSFPISEQAAISIIRGRRAKAIRDNQRIDHEDMQYRNDVLYVVSAGNENKDVRLTSPGSLSRPVDPGMGLPDISDRVISVGASGQGFHVKGSNYCKGAKDNDTDADPTNDSYAKRENWFYCTEWEQGADTRATFSNYGPGLDIAAPGVAVAAPNGTPNNTGDAVYLFDGTSAAAPMVAGTAALLKALDPSLEPAQLKQILIETATPIGDVPKPTGLKDYDGNPVSDDIAGWGGWAEPRRLDVLAAVQRVLWRLAHTDAGDAVGTNDGDQLESQSAVISFKYVPGQKRFAWVANSRKDRIAMVGGSGLPSTTGIFIDAQMGAPGPTESPVGCGDPVGLAVEPKGDKVYVACADSDDVLVLNGNVYGAADVARTPSTLELGSLKGINGNKVGMAVGPDGKFLFVPDSAKNGVIVVDIRRDEFIDYLFLPNGLHGAIRDVAVDSNYNVYALTAEDGRMGSLDRGSLIRIPATGPSQWDETAATQKALDWSWLPSVTVSGTPQTVADEPRGLAWQRIGSNEYLYVYYAGDRTTLTATQHDPETLEEIGGVLEQVWGRNGPGLAPGRPINVGDLNYSDRFTGTERAFDLVIDPVFGRDGFSAYFWTANLGLLGSEDPTQAQPLSLLRGASRVGGEFQVGVHTWYNLTAEPCVNATGVGTAVCSGLGLDQGVQALYLQDHFPTAADIDQSGELVAVTFTGPPPKPADAPDPWAPPEGFIRFYRAKELAANGALIEIDGDLDPATVPLDAGGLDLIPDTQTDVLKFDLDGPRDVKFGPQLAIVSPRPGGTSRGAVAVNVIVRDRAVEEVSCRVRKRSDFSVVAADGPASLTDGWKEQLTGYVRNAHENAQAFGREPPCLFNQLPDGDYWMEVEGTKGTTKFPVRVPFSYKNGVEP